MLVHVLSLDLSVAVHSHKNSPAGSDPSSPVNTRVLGRLYEEKKGIQKCILDNDNNVDGKKVGCM